MTGTQTAEAAVQQRMEQIATAMITQGVPIGTFHDLTDRDYEAVYTLGYNLYGQGKYEEAAKAFAFLTFYNHLERKYLKGLAACQQMLQRYDVAIQTYAVAAILDVHDPEPTLRTAECLIGMGMIDEARESLDLVIEETAGKPQYDALRTRAEALAELLKDRTGVSAEGGA